MQTQYATDNYGYKVSHGQVMEIIVQPYSPTGVPGPYLQVTDGTVTFDYTAATRRTCDLTITDPTRTLVPDQALDVLAPYGQALGVYYNPIDSPLIPMGVFYITEVDADDQGTQYVLTIKGADRSAKLARRALTSVYNIAAGTNYATAIQNLLAFVDPTITFNFTFTSYATPAIILDINQDPWAAALQMATAIGCDLFFDRTGICVLRPTPDPANLAPCWIYADRDLGYGMMLEELTKTVVTDQTVYNDVIVSGEDSGGTAVWSGRAQDTNIYSPTFIGGPFGDVPVFYKSSILTSNAQAQALANAKLLYYLGRSDQIQIKCFPNPIQDEEDVVRVVRSVDSVDSLYTIDKCEFSIAVAGQNATSSGGTSGTSTSGQMVLTGRGVIPGL